MQMKHLLLLASLLTCMGAGAQQATFRNPVIAGDMADPVIRVDNTYYATGTSSEWAPYYPLFRSKDLVNWRQIGHLFEQQPAWTRSSFWAPELFHRNGKTYAYYTARRKTDGTSYIGVATADKPEGPYTDHGPIVEYGTEAIDAFVLEDAGELYISWKAYRLDPRPIELLACKISDDGLRMAGEPFTLLRDGDLLIGYRLQGTYAKNDVVLYEQDGKLRVGRVLGRENDLIALDDSGTLIVNGSAQSGEILYPTYAKDTLEYPYTVPADSVFILGDYRTQSEDSRDFGPVALTDVKAKVITLLRRRSL